jgi:diaminopimelate epimerase
MMLRFTKMQGAGNDFVMIDAVSQRVDVTPALARRLADRRFGVGADQVLVVEPARASGTDFRYRIFNQDGGEVEQCGNGARCFVKFVHARGLTEKRVLRVETLGGIIAPRLQDDGEVTVDMGCPSFEPARVPFDATGLVPVVAGRAPVWALALGDHSVPVTVVSIGNPHAVQVVDDVAVAPLATEGPLIEHHRRFPQRVNAGFLQILDRHTARLRVWERGVGETLACGSGACAAIAAAVARGLLDSPVALQARGGRLHIAWAGGASDPVLMTGPASQVFDGEIALDPGSEP